MSESLNRKRQIEELKLVNVELNPYRNIVIEEVATEIQSKGTSMTEDDLKLVFDALNQCNTYAFAGGLGVRATAHTNALAILEKALAQPEQLHASEDVSIGVDVTEDGAHVTALRSYRNGAKVVFYSQFHSAPQRTEQEPFAWAEFDGEGSYFLRLYENNETYAEYWNKRNPNHIGWVEPIYKYPPQRTWVGLTEQQHNDIEDACEMIIGKPAFDAIEAKLKDKNS